MSSEYTRGFVIKFLPAQFSWIYVAFEEFLNRNFIHWNILHFIVYLKVAVKNSLIIWMQFDTGYEFACVQTSPIRKYVKILWNMVLQPNFFSLLSAQNEVNELLPVNSLLFVAVMHQSIPPAPRPPPGWPPGISIFFALDGKFPGVGALELSNPPGWGRKKGQMPRPLSTLQHFSLII